MSDRTTWGWPRAEFTHEGESYVAILTDADSVRALEGGGNVEIYLVDEGREVFLAYAHDLATVLP